MQRQNSQPASRCRSAMTLIELLVVISIIVLLLAILLPALQEARRSANRLACTNNLRQLAIAAHHHHDVRDRFPCGVRIPRNAAGGTNWIVELLPYLEEQNLHQDWDYNDNGKNVSNGTTAQVLEFLICPSDTLSKSAYDFRVAALPAWQQGLYGQTSYGGNAGRRSFFHGGGPNFPGLSRDGVFYVDSSVRVAEITDGASNTVLFGERDHYDPQYDRIAAPFPALHPLASVGLWAWVGPGAMIDVHLSTPVEINYRVPRTAAVGNQSLTHDRLCAFGSGHGGGANFAFADMSVRFLKETTSLATLQALSTRAGDEVTTAP
jgi:prepilin-type N-terminal cleavage/methylation domain-containing protein/prepilin-type processing-associated H-X9-DG protein